MEDDCGRPWNDPHPFGRPLRPKTKVLEQQGPAVDRLQVEATERQVPWRDDYNEARPCEVAVISGCGMCGLVRALPGNTAQGLRSSFRRAVRAVTACHGVLRRLPPRRRRHPPANSGIGDSVATAEAAAAPPSFTLNDELADRYRTAPSSPRAWSSIGHGVFAAPFHGTAWRSSASHVGTSPYVCPTAGEATPLPAQMQYGGGHKVELHLANPELCLHAGLTDNCQRYSYRGGEVSPTGAGEGGQCLIVPPV
ncbi:hypothetical protein VOLCADRAFT_92366 [Volvox carteri f. nagariensis]|uniref:Uncharacterized protein n=1 Tax=Volvox carteri f. nagariensis TaxID=3068 RepID=D8TZH0_VOLCA|nr:uncharacterized protein VOLCADRAFT_92366 [Volvox carteri f. nagariensis]EFJ47181.1 hypothetical protein VOLCADRAFT_92366 [Volvox carteri f. nagariensis]|eukprot:XP_002951730.1 hypothetical protein VOLCADRAFT_92366 [Volvox carteri f. nagariensis]